MGWSRACCYILEKFSLRIANVVIATNGSYREIEITRHGVQPERIFIVRNGPDLKRVRLVEPDARLRSMGRTIFCYLGAMNPQDGLDYLLRALGHLLHDLGRTDFYCVLIGDGDSLDELKAQAVALGLQDHVFFTGFIPDEDMMRYLSSADVCMDPNPSSPLNDVSTWIKVMEYMALSKPIVSFALKETQVSAGGRRRVRAAQRRDGLRQGGRSPHGRSGTTCPNGGNRPRARRERAELEHYLPQPRERVQSTIRQGVGIGSRITARGASLRSGRAAPVNGNEHVRDIRPIQLRLAEARS